MAKVHVKHDEQPNPVQSLLPLGASLKMKTMGSDRNVDVFVLFIEKVLCS